MDTLENKGNNQGPGWLLFLSIAGSVSSMVALLIVLIQQAAPRPDVSTQAVVWRIVMAMIALVASSSIIVYAYLHCRAIHLSQLSAEKKLMHVSLTIILALLALGISLDGLFAALRWNWWLAPIKTVIKQIFSS